jgi:hypothetical protein
MLIGPHLAGEWTPKQVWATGFVKTYASSLTTAVETYSTDNCAVQTEIEKPVDAQEMFFNFLTRKSGQSIGSHA